MTHHLGELALPTAKSMAEMAQSDRNRLLLAALRSGTFDFLDFGSHKGGGLRYGLRIGGKSGLGIEVDDRKTIALLASGLYVINANVLDIPDLPKSVDFAICSHVLEHLPDEASIFLVIKKLSVMCRKFILVEQPDFSSELYLYSQGLKMAHFTMDGHNCHVRTRDLIEMLWDLNLGRFILGAKIAILDSTHSWVHRADAMPPLWIWTESKSLPKPLVKFERELFRDIVLIVGCNSQVDLDEIAGQVQLEKIIMRCYDSLL